MFITFTGFFEGLQFQFIRSKFFFFLHQKLHNLLKLFKKLISGTIQLEIRVFTWSKEELRDRAPFCNAINLNIQRKTNKGYEVRIKRTGKEMIIISFG